MYTTSFIRSSLARGASVLALTLLLFCGTGCRNNKSTDSDAIQPTTMEVTTCTTFTTATHTTTTSTTTKTTLTTTTEVTTTKIQPETTSQTIAVVTEPVCVEPEAVEPTTEYIEPVTEYIEPAQTSNLPITDYERTLLRNVVANEYGSDYVPVAEKAKVVAVVMNRVNSPQFPNTIEAVLTQRYQFSGYWACSYEWNSVTDSVREAVNYYFAHPDEFGNWLYFEGDGTWNYFS